MLKNYLIVALRHILKNKLFTLINISGLAIGMASFVLVLLYVNHEYKYDRYNKNAERIYRVVEYNTEADEKYGDTPKLLLPTIIDAVPEIENGTRISNFYGSVSVDNKVFFEENFFLCDSSVFDVFSWKMILGHKNEVFKDAHSIIISKRISEKYFGEQNPIGEIIKYENEYNYVVKGIFEIPEKTHLKIDFIAPMSGLKFLDEFSLTSWIAYGANTYLLLKKGSDISSVEDKITKIAKEHSKGNLKNSILQLQPLLQLYLHSNDLLDDSSKHGNIQNIKIFVLVSVLILLIACFNYINLSTAKEASRAKEIGVRKVLGAHKRILMKQLLGESLIVTIFAAVLSLLIIEISLPWFTNISGTNIQFWDVWKQIVILIGILVLFISVFAGAYPAFVLSKQQPIIALHSNKSVNVKKAFLNINFRSLLLIMQIGITMGLIIASIVIYRQMEFVGNKNLGFDKKQLLVIENPYSEKMYQRYYQFKDAIAKYPSIISFAASSDIPSKETNYHGQLRLKGQTHEKSKAMGFISGDFNFLKTMRATIISGRDFSSKNLTDSISACILNQAAVVALKIKKPLGKKLTGFWGKIKEKTVIGVIENIHYNSLHEKPEPITYVVSRTPIFATNFILRVSTKEIAETISFLEKEFKKIAPGRPFQYYFIDKSFDNLYKVEQRVKTVVTIFTLIAVFISVFGLFGLILFITESKTKEISIRKVFGANVKVIVYSILKDFSKLIAFAAIITMPIAYFSLDKWLENFAYHIDIGFGVFVLALLLSLFIVFATIIYQTYKAANTNPAKALKYE